MLVCWRRERSGPSGWNKEMVGHSYCNWSWFWSWFPKCQEVLDYCKAWERRVSQRIVSVDSDKRYNRILQTSWRSDWLAGIPKRLCPRKGNRMGRWNTQTGRSRHNKISSLLCCIHIWSYAQIGLLSQNNSWHAGPIGTSGKSCKPNSHTNNNWAQMQSIGERRFIPTGSLWWSWLWKSASRGCVGVQLIRRNNCTPRRTNQSTTSIADDSAVKLAKRTSRHKREEDVKEKVRSVYERAPNNV